MAFWFGGSSDDDDRGGGNAVAGFLMMILGPIAAMLIQMAISRSREYSADEASAKYTHSPGELISALGKLDSYSKQIPMQASPSTAHLFIIKPFTGQWFIENLLNPPLHRRPHRPPPANALTPASSTARNKSLHKLIDSRANWAHNSINRASFTVPRRSKCEPAFCCLCWRWWSFPSARGRRPRQC